MAIGANLTQREQSFIALGVLGLLAAGAFGYFVYNPKRETLAATAAHVDSVETMNRQARVDLTRGTARQLQAEAEQYQRNLELMRQLVPTSNEVPALLESISNAARRVGLDIATVEPAPVIPGDQFDTYRYKISVIGGYHAVARFLTNVGSLDRIIAPVGLDLKLHAATGPGATPANAAKSAKPQIDATFQVQTYVARTRPLAGDDAGDDQ